MDKSSVLQRVREYAELVRKTLDVQQVILFGSYVKGAPTEWSDIDVAVVVDTPPVDWMKVSQELFRLSRDIDLSIEPVLIVASRDRSSFLAEIRKTGEMIYNRE